MDLPVVEDLIHPTNYHQANSYIPNSLHHHHHHGGDSQENEISALPTHNHQPSPAPSEASIHSNPPIIITTDFSAHRPSQFESGLTTAAAEPHPYEKLAYGIEPLTTDLVSGRYASPCDSSMFTRLRELNERSGQIMYNVQTLRSEYGQRAKLFSELNGCVTQMGRDRPTEDISRPRNMLQSINARWNEVTIGLDAHSIQLENTAVDIENFSERLDAFRGWLTIAEPELQALHSEVESIELHRKQDPAAGGASLDRAVSVTRASAHAPASPMTAATLCNQYEDLTTSIDDHRSQFDAIQVAGRQLSNSASGLSSSRTLSSGEQEKLEETEQRWAELVARHKSLSSLLNEYTEKWSGQLLVIREIKQWLEKAQAEYNSLLPAVSADKGFVGEQIVHVKRLLGELATRKPAYSTAIESINSALCTTDTGDSDKEAKTTERQKRALVFRLANEARIVSATWIKFEHNLNIRQRTLNTLEGKLNELGVALQEIRATLEEHERFLDNDMAPVTSVKVEDLQRELDDARQYQQKISPLEARVDRCNDLYNSALSDASVVASPQLDEQLKELGLSWRRVRDVALARLRKLEDLLRDVGPSSQQFLSASVSSPWEREVAPNKVPYYLNHDTASTHWDHPLMTRFFASIGDMNGVRFSAYRTAMKLRALQKLLRLDLAAISVVREAMSALSGVPDRLINVTDVTDVLTILFDKLKSQYTGSDTVVGNMISVPLCVDLALNWLLNTHDISRTGQIRLISLKVSLALLCRGHLEEKYRYIFAVAASHPTSGGSSSSETSPSYLDRTRLALLLYECIQVPRQLGEVAAFGGTNVEPSVASCFKLAGNESDISIRDWLQWLKLEPQSLVWVPVLHRLAAAESVKHQAKCNICKLFPIVGFRYRCLRCFNFDICQNCFFTGRRAKNHKLSHPMQEYCVATTSGEDVRDFGRVLRNKMRGRRRSLQPPPLGYLPVDTNDSRATNQNGTSAVPVNKHSTDDIHQRISMFTSRLAELDRQKLGGSANAHPKQEDEHALIAQYCTTLTSTDETTPSAVKKKPSNPDSVPSSVTTDEAELIARLNGDIQHNDIDMNGETEPLKSPVQIMLAVDGEQKRELATVIQQLEDENRNLLNEYDRLQTERASGTLLPRPMGGSMTESVGGQMPRTPTGTMYYSGRMRNGHQGIDNALSDNEAGGAMSDSQDEELIAEARLLRQHKGRLESRMQILEDHNRQLEMQLSRLRHLLHSDSSGAGQPGSGAGAALSASTSAAVTSPAGAAPMSQSQPSSATNTLSTGARNQPASLFDASSPHTPRMGDRASMERKPPSYASTSGGPTLSTESTTHQSTANVESLFEMAGEVSKAVGSLVTCMTSDEVPPSPEPSPTHQDGTPESHQAATQAHPAHDEVASQLSPTDLQPSSPALLTPASTQPGSVESSLSACSRVTALETAPATSSVGSDEMQSSR